MNPPPAAHTADAPASVLVVEDEAIVAADLQEQLRRLGYAIAGAAVSGEEAIRKAGELRPDLVLMDIILHGAIDGIEAAAAIRELHQIPVIFLTANSNEDFLTRAKVTEPFGYLLKPYDNRHLRTNIEMALYKARLDRERATLLAELQEALAEVKTLGGLLPMCAWCKNVRDDDGYWSAVEAYVERNSEARFSHSVCPECLQTHFPEAGGGHDYSARSPAGDVIG